MIPLEINTTADIVFGKLEELEESMGCHLLKST